MYTLYYSPGSASMVVHLALLELGVPHRLERVDTSQPRTALDWPALARLAQRVRARPAWKTLYEREELIEW